MVTKMLGLRAVSMVAVFVAILGSGLPGAAANGPNISPPTIVSATTVLGTRGFIYSSKQVARNSQNAVSLTGAAPANATITAFEGQTQLGTTVAAADGSWNLRTAPLTSGTHAITATATVNGNISAQSEPTNVSIDSLVTINSMDANWIYANGSVYPNPFTWNIDSGPDQSGIAGSAQLMFDPAMMPNLSGSAIPCRTAVCNCRFMWQAPSTFIRRWSVHRMVNIKYVQHSHMAPQFSHIGNFRSMPTKWNVSIGGDTEDINVAWDIFFFPKASETTDRLSSQVAELMVWLHQPITNPIDGFGGLPGGQALHNLSPLSHQPASSICQWQTHPHGSLVLAMAGS